MILLVVVTGHDAFLLNVCDIFRPQLQIHSVVFFFFKVSHSLCSFSDIPVLGRSFAWWFMAANLHLKPFREYSASGRPL